MARSIAEIKMDLMTQGMRTEIGTIKGRKGGAGPAGGRFFRLKDGSCVNVPLWPKFTEKSSYSLIDDQVFYEGVPLKDVQLVPIPKFYEKSTSDNVPMNQIALLHGTECIASTVVQTCIYWKKGIPCQFCGIEMSLRTNTTIASKTPTQLREVIGAAIEEKVCNHVTLTIGSLPRPDKGARIYVKILKEIKDYYDIPVHVQLEPPEALKSLKTLYEAGVDTIGIHIESFDHDVLQAVCPGKSNISLEKYKKTWVYAVQLFGENQVDSYILLGLGESNQSIIQGSQMLLELGVIPYIVPFRPIMGTPLENNPTPVYSRLIEIFTEIAQLMRDSGNDPTKNRAGCVRCGGCSPLTEAYKYL